MKLGASFGESIVEENHRSRISGSDSVQSWWLGSGRILLFSVVLCLGIFALIIRLVDLTLIQGHRYRLLSEANRTRELVRHAPRGIIRDRTGTPMVDNSSVLRVAGKYTEPDFRRIYRYGPSIAHVIGYTGEISGDELKKEYYQLRGYRPGDRIGRMGAEAIFEEKLHGRDGKELTEVDATGKIVRMLGRDAEISGEDVTLSIDLALSDVVSRTFPAGQKGAVIVSKPSTGEILVLYSSPSFDPTEFSLGMTSEQYTHLTQDVQLPLFNRAISGVYPPGSTFKLVTAIAGLETGSVTPATTIEDTGIIKTGTFSFANWYFTQYGRTEGRVNLSKAISRSNDIYFYKLGEKIGIDSLAKWANRLGVGVLTGIELSGEVPGLMPDREWKDQRFHTDRDLEQRNNLWYDGDTYHVAIGQGYLLTTPLQVNHWTNTTATGQICSPTIEKVSENGRAAVCRTIALSPKTLPAIQQGMVNACDTGGTAYPFFGFSVNAKRIPVACKTGTAEYGDPKNNTHAWFTAYAPVPESFTKQLSLIKGSTDMITGEPEISVTVLVEEAGEGSKIAAPIAKTILEAWFSR